MSFFSKSLWREVVTIFVYAVFIQIFVVFIWFWYKLGNVSTSEFFTSWFFWEALFPMIVLLLYTTIVLGTIFSHEGLINHISGHCSECGKEGASYKAGPCCFDCWPKKISEIHKRYEQH